jgi:GntR family transcriptional regulator
MDDSNHTSGGLPLYHQVYLHLKEKIGTEWPVGTRLSPEPVLARNLGVSRATMRHALALAQRDGLLVRKKAKGTFVDGGGVVTSQKVTGSFMHLLQFDKRISVEVLPASKRGDLLPEVLTRVRELGLLDAARMRRRVLLSGAPLSYMENFVDKAVLRRIDVKRLARTPLIATVEKVLKIKIARAQEEIEAAIATPYLAELLRVGAGTPLLRVQRLYYGVDDSVVDYGIVWYRADRYRFTVELTRDAWEDNRKEAAGERKQPQRGKQRDRKSISKTRR